MPAGILVKSSPVKGLNLRKPSIQLDAEEALYLDNLLPTSSGVELRAGYQEIVTGIGAPVITIAPYVGSDINDSKAFAFNSKGEIYDSSISTDKPEPLAVTEQIDGVWDYTNSQGGDENFLVMVSPRGGFWTYSKRTGLVRREITGDGEGKKFSGVFNWKDRIWLIESESSKAYYLESNAIQGAAKVFDFGGVMNSGGYLSYGSDWTFNAGKDIDDYLVLVTTAGEVIVYSGYDPTDAQTFQLKGVWYVGKTPYGNKCFTAFGGDLFIMSSLGVVAVSKLVNGGVANDYQVVSANIQPKLREIFSIYSNNYGWEMETVYNQNYLFLKCPVNSSGQFNHWIMNLQTGAWATISGVPMNCSSRVMDSVYFGTDDGKVCKAFVGDRDGTQRDGSGGEPVIGRFISGFDDYGSPTNLKAWQLARPVLVSTDAPSLSIKIITEYGEKMNDPLNPLPDSSGKSIWDLSHWDEAVFSGGIGTYSAWIGLAGLGYYGALAVAIKGKSSTQYISTHITANTGGVI